MYSFMRLCVLFFALNAVLWVKVLARLKERLQTFYIHICIFFNVNKCALVLLTMSDCVKPKSSVFCLVFGNTIFSCMLILFRKLCVWLVCLCDWSLQKCRSGCVGVGVLHTESKLCQNVWNILFTFFIYFYFLLYFNKVWRLFIICFFCGLLVVIITIFCCFLFIYFILCSNSAYMYMYA